MTNVSLHGINKSLVTLHLYLNDNGMATRFWTPDKKDWLDAVRRASKGRKGAHFQQRMLMHRGEVTKGVKCTVRGDILFEQVVQ